MILFRGFQEGIEGNSFGPGPNFQVSDSFRMVTLSKIITQQFVCALQQVDRQVSRNQRVSSILSLSSFKTGLAMR